MPFGRLFCAEKILPNDSSVKNRVIVQEYGLSFNSIAIVQEFIYMWFSDSRRSRREIRHW